MSASLLNSVRACGYAPFDFIGQSDHRGLYMDINIGSILDANIYNMQPNKHRRLKSTIPKRVDKYLEIMEKKWANQSIERRFQNALILAQNKQLQELEIELNKIDKSISEIMHHAEKKCSYIPTQNLLHWSPTLKNALNGLRSARLLRTKMQFIQPGQDVSEVKANYVAACKTYDDALAHYRDVKTRHVELRKEYLKELANDLALKNNTSQACELNKLRNIEKQRGTHVKINYVLKPDSRDGVHSILIPAQQTYSECVDDHHCVDEMWRRIQPRNGKDIDCWERVTKEQLDSAEFQKKVMNGTYVPPDDLPEEARDLFTFMQRHDDVQDLPFTSTYEEFCEFIKKSDETTSVSPSGRSYSHYKSLLQGDKTYLQTIHAIIELCVEHQIILTRWKKTVTTLIEKEKGFPYIHRMRAIHIIEAEVQFLAKIHYVKKMMGVAESKNLITEEQYGGRRKKQAQSAVINKILYHNICRQRLMTSAFMDDDARACYYRIVTSLSGVEGRKWGASYELSSFTTKFIESQEYSLRTGHGISEGNYKYDDEHPIQGSGQGIGWAGPRWWNSSDTCSRIMEKRCAGMEFSDPSSELRVTKRGVFFVDDTATGVTINRVFGTNTILEQLSHDEQKHAHILFAMGHKLALDKCSYYILTFQRDGIKHECSLIHEYPGDIWLRETFTSTPIKIKRLQPFTAHRTLGCFIAIGGNQRRQHRVLLNKVKDWKKEFTSSFLIAEDRLTSYDAYIKKSIQFVAPTTCLDQSQCHELDKKITPILYNAYGIQRNCSKCILYGPSLYGGFGHFDTWHIKGLEKLKFLFMHYRRHDVTGKLYKISMRWTQLELGLPKPFYNYNHRQYSKYVTATLVTDLWDYLTYCHSTLIESNPWTYEPPRRHDFFLNQVVMESVISDDHKMIFNEIRIALHLITASDIVTISGGNIILPNIHKCINYRDNKLQWPNTLAFPDRWIKVWSNILTTVIQPILTSTPLGLWINPSHQIWVQKLSFSQDHAFDGEHHYKIVGPTSRRRKYRKITESFPCDLEAVLLVENDTVHLIVSDIRTECSNLTLEPSTLQELFTRAPKWQKENWGQEPIPLEVLQKIKKELTADNISCAGDGSVLLGRAAHAWSIFRKNDYKMIYKGSADVGGDPRDINSLRPETFGCIAAFSLLNMIAAAIPNISAKVTYFTDSDNTILNSKRQHVHDVASVLENDIDGTIELTRIMKKSKITFSLAHVKAHQELNNNKTEYTPLEKINMMMDELASEHVQNAIKNSTVAPRPLFLPSQQIAVKIKNSIVVSNVEDKIRGEFYKNDVKRHYRNTIGLQEKHFDNVNWEGLRLATRNHKNRKQILKCLHNQWPVLDRNHRWNLNECNICVMCNKEVETWQHVLQCTSIHMWRCRENSICNIKKELQTLKTNPILTEHIIGAIYAWVKGEIPTPPPLSFEPYVNEVRQAHLHQYEIGYDLFMKGILDVKWQKIQERFISDQKSGKHYNIKRWIKKVTELLLEHCVTCYKERCSIIAAEGKSDYEKQIRVKAAEFWKDLNMNLWKMPSDSMHLLERSDRFFENGNLTMINEWRKNVTTALERNNRKIEKITTNMNPEITKKSVDRQADRETERQEQISLAAEFRKQMKAKAKAIQNRIQQNISSLFSRLKY